MKKLLILSLIAGFLTTAACGSKPTFPEGTNIAENESGGVTFKVTAIKNKEKSIDIIANVMNGYAHDVLIKESSFLLTYENEKVQIRTGDGDLILRSGATTEKVMIFKMGENDKRPPGDITLDISPILNSSTNKPVKPIHKVLPMIKGKLEFK